MKLNRSLFLAVALAGSALLARAAGFELKPGENIALIGNGTADRMQHHGWLETLLHARYPKHNLVFRNLAAAADDVGGFLDKPAKSDNALRNRSENFGSNDDWLKRVQADVVFAFFGYNESFRGDAGLEKFKTDLDTFVKETKGKNYSGKAAPRLVLFGPLAAEKSSDPNLPPVDATNANLKKYSTAMAEVAKANDVPFVDLFTLSLDAYAQAAKQKRALTFNTVHLTEAGDRALAPDIFRALIGETAPGGKLDKLNAAVNDKNKEFHARYRTVDGYNVYGGRSGLAFQAGVRPFKSNLREPEAPLISNYQTMQDEMRQRDAMMVKIGILISRPSTEK